MQSREPRAGVGKAHPIAGWGGVPTAESVSVRPDSVSRLAEWVACAEVRDWIARGLGRAYGDSAINDGGGVLRLTGLDRLLDFDPETGVLDCEAGVSLTDVIETFLPRGFFLHTSPGTRFVTVGGAIAADVHGKNHHHAGGFGVCVLDLTLLLADGRLVRCSPQENVDLFHATIGGMGLTGVIVRARIRLRRVASAYYRVRTHRLRDLDAALEAFATHDGDAPCSVAWIDCLARGRALGRSVLMLGREASPDELPRALRSRPYEVARRLRPPVPFLLPKQALNPATVAAFNEAYWLTHRGGERLIDYDTHWYPLDRVPHWNRIYGKRGFVQYQAWLPRRSSRDGLIALLEAISASRRASFLSVLKSCGPASPGLLSVLDDGHTLALDLPYDGAPLHALFGQLDAILLRHGGRLYLAKDALTTRESFTAMAPRLAEFRAVKDRVDPAQRFSSSQARRVGLVGGERR